MTTATRGSWWCGGIRVLAVAAIVGTGCGPLRCVGPAKNISGREPCYFAWKGSVRDSLVMRGDPKIFNRYRPLHDEVASVKFPVWLPERLADRIDRESFLGYVDPAGTVRLHKSGRVWLVFEHPARFEIIEMTQKEWDNGGAAFAMAEHCYGEAVELPSASGTACLEVGQRGGGIYWQTTDGVHVYVMAASDHGVTWTADDFLVVARSMVRLR
jgi:hypothetical protein